MAAAVSDQRQQRRPRHNVMDTALEAGQLPPQAPELEKAVLGAVMLEKHSMADVADILTEQAFYVHAHALIWKAVAQLYAVRDPIDILTVTQRLKHHGTLDQVGGAFYISTLTNHVASTANVQYHARLILQFYIKREQIRIGSEMMRSGYDLTQDVFDSIAGVGSEIRLLNEFGSGDEVTMASMMPQVVDTHYKDTGIPFGFADIDRKIRAEPGTITIVGARPAMGKTAFMLSSAKRQAWMKHKSYIAEMEMKSRNLATRLICGECGVPVWKVKRNALTEKERDRMAKWHVDHGDLLLNMILNESASMTTSSLAARLDRAKRREGIDVVWVDYIGLMQPSEKQKDAYHRMTRISNELRVMAKEIDLPFIVLAQLSRPVKGTTVKPPALSDLRDSGEIEQDAEGVIFLHRPKYYDPGADDTVEVIVAKNRDGEDGQAEIEFDGPGVRMVDKEKYHMAPLQPFTKDAQMEDEPF